MATHKLGVVVHGGDPLSRAGLVGILEQRGDLTVLEDGTATADGV